MALATDIQLSAAAGRIESSVLRDMYALTERPGMISLAGGLPAPATFPIDAVGEATAAVLAADGEAAVQYSATEGYGPLRERIAADRGVDVDQVTITAGSQQGLDLVARTLIDPGDVLAAADPSYLGALQAFQLSGAQPVGLRSDAHGLVVDDLEERLAAGFRPRVLYVVANLGNPTGATLPEDRRDQLAGLADRYGFWVVEDDPYSALRWAGEAPRPLGERSDRVISLSTASKVLCPGLRVGFVVAQAPVSAALVRVKQAADLHTSTLGQRIIHELLHRPGFLEERLATLPEAYRTRAEALTAALRRHLGDAVELTPPQGGMFVWARLPVDTTALLPRALDEGVAFVAGSAFGVSERHENHMRLSFATATLPDFDEGVVRLARAMGLRH